MVADYLLVAVEDALLYLIARDILEPGVEVVGDGELVGATRSSKSDGIT